MSHTRSALLVMKAFLLLISLPQHVYAYNDGEMNRKDIAQKQSFISAQDHKEVVYSLTSGTKMKMEQLGGRKMAVPRKFDITKHTFVGSHGGATPLVISGSYDNYNNIELGGSQHQYTHQEQKRSKKREPSIQKKSGILGSPRHEQVLNTNSKTNECKESKAKPTKSSSEAPKPKAEKQRLLLMEEEMVSLMHKDYKGVERPRRKPPINNHVPIH